jgi:hypothetical protein
MEASSWDLAHLDGRLLAAYVEARLHVSRYLDDPTPIAAVWTAFRTVELMLINRGWTEAELDETFARHERDQLMALDADGWREQLAQAMTSSTDRGVRVAQALNRYRELAGGPAD